MAAATRSRDGVAAGLDGLNQRYGLLGGSPGGLDVDGPPLTFRKG